jgi:hypothetical protein
MCGQEKDIKIIIESIMNAIAMVHIIINDQDTAICEHTVHNKQPLPHYQKHRIPWVM